MEVVNVNGLQPLSSALTVTAIVSWLGLSVSDHLALHLHLLALHLGDSPSVCGTITGSN